MKFEFCRQIFEKDVNIKFHQNPSNGGRVVPCGRTDITKLIVAFRNFKDASKSKITVYGPHLSGQRSLIHACLLSYWLHYVTGTSLRASGGGKHTCWFKALVSASQVPTFSELRCLVSTRQASALAQTAQRIQISSNDICAREAATASHSPSERTVLEVGWKVVQNTNVRWMSILMLNSNR